MINLFTPIDYGPNRTTFNSFIEMVDNYLSLGGKKAVVISSQAHGNAEGVVLRASHPSCIGTAFKVISYASVILPIIALTVKCIFRHTHHFYIIDENAKAIGIQCAWRSFKARKTLASLKASYVQRNNAATTLQKSARSYLAKKQAAVKVKEKKEQRDAAATLFQSIFRGYDSRIKTEKRKKPLLSYPLFLKAKESVAHGVKLPEVASGSTMWIYSLKDSNLILKRSKDNQKVQERFRRMLQAQEVCERNGYQNLVVPKVRPSGVWLFEQELPINPGIRSSIGLYLEHLAQFTDVVKEFVGFLSQSYLGDIIGNTNNMYASIAEIPLPRYDNIGLYIEEGKGKIGLIDLAEFSPRPRKEIDIRSLASGCETSIRFFPYHFDEILDQAKALDPSIEKYRPFFEKIRGEALILFKLLYEDHLAFMKEKGITLDRPFQMVEIGPLRREALAVAVISQLRDNGNAWYLPIPEEEVLDLVKISFSKILDLVIAHLSETIKKKIEILKPVSDSDLLISRTLFLDDEIEFYEILEESITKELGPKFIVSSYEKRKVSRAIVQDILKELAKGGEVAYYNPHLGQGLRGSECLFC